MVDGGPNTSAAASTTSTRPSALKQTAFHDGSGANRRHGLAYEDERESLAEATLREKLAQMRGYHNQAHHYDELDTLQEQLNKAYSSASTVACSADAFNGATLDHALQEKQAELERPESRGTPPTRTLNPLLHMAESVSPHAASQIYQAHHSSDPSSRHDEQDDTIAKLQSALATLTVKQARSEAMLFELAEDLKFSIQHQVNTQQHPVEQLQQAYDHVRAQIGSIEAKLDMFMTAVGTEPPQPAAVSEPVQVKPSNKKPTNLLEQPFEAIDTNNDGFIDREEFIAAATRHHSPPELSKFTSHLKNPAPSPTLASVAASPRNLFNRELPTSPKVTASTTNVASSSTWEGSSAISQLLSVYGPRIGALCTGSPPLQPSSSSANVEMPPLSGEFSSTTAIKSMGQDELRGIVERIRKEQTHEPELSRRRTQSTKKMKEYRGWDSSTNCDWDHQKRGPKSTTGRKRSQPHPSRSQQLRGRVTWTSKNGRPIHDSLVHSVAQKRMLTAPVIARDGRLNRRSEEIVADRRREGGVDLY